MKKGISIWSLPNDTLKNNFELAQKAGFEGVEVTLDEAGDHTVWNSKKDDIHTRTNQTDIDWEGAIL